MRRVLALVIAVAAFASACSGSATADDPDTLGAETSSVAEESTENPAETTASTEAETTEAADNATDAVQLFPDVIDATAELAADGTWTISATLSSPYDTPERYADAWQVVGPDGTIYGERFLTHDHAGEQPFTRSQSGIDIPEDVTIVTIQGRDQVSGWGGATFELVLAP